MSDSVEHPAAGSSYEALKARTEALERQLAEAEVQSALRIRQSELKGEAVRAGIIDLDGLRLLDPATMAGAEDAFDPVGVIARLRRDKPWLFGSANSSSSAVVPVAVQSRKRLATEMSVEEWRAARAEILRRR